MSDFLQPGQHLDAEQLSSFAENALPAHEREFVLGHLAICTTCRKIVSLSLPPAEETAAALPAARRRAWSSGWFAGWNLAWPVAGAALAAGLLVVISLHKPSPGLSRDVARVIPGQVAPTQMAANAEPAPPARVFDEASPPAAAQKVSPALPAKIPLPPPPASLAAVAGAAGASSISGFVEDKQIQNLPLQGRSYSPSQQGVAAPLVAGSFHGQLPQPAPAVPAAAPPSGVAKAVGPAFVAAAPAPLANDASSTMDAVAANGAILGREVRNGVSVAALAPSAVAALPSHLAIASSVAHDSNLLALDTAGALFLSRDSGHHWQTVAAPWRGRTVLLTPASTPVPLLKPAPALPSPAAASSSIYSTAISLTGTISDPAGAIIPNATITLTNGSAINRTKTDKTGQYVFDNLPAGTYQLAVESPGFMTYQSSAALAVGRQNVLNVRLNLGAASETVTVEASSSAVAIEDAPRKRKALKKSESPAIAPPAFAVTTGLRRALDQRRWPSLAASVKVRRPAKK